MALKVIVLSFVDDQKAAADGGKVRTQCGILIPAVLHQLNELNIIGFVVRWNGRTERGCFTSAHTDEYI